MVLLQTECVYMLKPNNHEMAFGGEFFGGVGLGVIEPSWMGVMSL